VVTPASNNASGPEQNPPSSIGNRWLPPGRLTPDATKKVGF